MIIWHFLILIQSLELGCIAGTDLLIRKLSFGLLKKCEIEKKVHGQEPVNKVHKLSPKFSVTNIILKKGWNEMKNQNALIAPQV